MSFTANELKQETRQRLFREPTRSEWRLIILVGMLAALLPVVGLVIFFVESGAPRQLGDALILITGIFGFLLFSVWCGVLAASWTLVLVRCGRACLDIHRRLDEAHRCFAHEVNGQTQYGRGQVRISFSREGQEACLEVLKEQSGEDTLVHTTLSFPEGVPEDIHCHVFPKGILEALAVRLGMQDIPLGHPDFDEVFIVRTSNPCRVSQRVDRNVQEVLLQMRHWLSQRPFPAWHRGEARHLELVMKEGTLQLRIRDVLESTGRINAFSDYGFQLCELLKEHGKRS